MAAQQSKTRELATAIGFLSLNILGVVTFVIFPVVLSLIMAFTNWDLRRHNMFRNEPLEFIGFANFVRLLTESDFLRYFGNTLFMMMVIPFSVGGALLSAILLSKDTRAGGGRNYAFLLAGGVLVISSVVLVVLGVGASATTILFVGVACGILLMGMGGGLTVYRTLFYTPHFTAGVATFILWKKLFNPEGGPINQGLQPMLDGVATTVDHSPPTLVQAGFWLMLTLAAAVLGLAASRLRRWWCEGELGSGALLIGCALLLIPFAMGVVWSYTQRAWWLLALAPAVVASWQLMRSGGRRLERCAPMAMMGTAMIFSVALMALQFIFIGLAPVFWHLPDMVAGTGATDAPGLAPPLWIHDYHWAKPSLMVVMLWSQIGSNNMLLYLAALMNVPPQLYEAADIDGAGRWTRFWHVTWPQLAPTTFFIAVMSTIHGFQGGFEIARTMTEGGPAGATTTLSYFIYTEGFQTGRLAFAAATAWVLFLLVLALTLVNWTFGNRYVND